MTNCRTRRLGLDVNTQPDDFFINSELVRDAKGPHAPENFPFIVGYGYHFDAGLLGEYLGKLAVSRGVTHLQKKIVDVAQDESGEISALVDESGERVEGDVFVDCTGFASLLMQKTLGVKFESFKSNLFNDSAVVMPTPGEECPRPETVSDAMSNGWCWKIPLTNRYGNGYVYAYGDVDEGEPLLHVDSSGLMALAVRAGSATSSLSSFSRRGRRRRHRWQAPHRSWWWQTRHRNRRRQEGRKTPDRGRRRQAPVDHDG